MATTGIAMEIEENSLIGADYAEPRVHFNEEIEVDVIKHINTRPKHKARRRSKSASNDEETVEVVVPKPLATSKLRKLMDKDRHLSRSGKGRGQPKKGMNSTITFKKH